MDYAKMVYRTLIALGLEQARNSFSLKYASELKAQLVVGKESDAVALSAMQVQAGRDLVQNFCPHSYSAVFER